MSESEWETRRARRANYPDHNHSLMDACRDKCPAYAQMQLEKLTARNALGQAVPSAQNNRGEWVPAIPEPYFLLFGRTRCECGEKIKSRQRYREHYALVHILGLS